jgi:hypothetical protein
MGDWVTPFGVRWGQKDLRSFDGFFMISLCFLGLTWGKLIAVFLIWFG